MVVSFEMELIHCYSVLFVFAHFVQLNLLQKDMVVPPKYLKSASIAAGPERGEGTSVRLEF